jgi:hypothetical protein
MDIIDEVIKWFLSFFNLQKYDILELALFGLGFVSWVIAYYFILKDNKKYGICEMPMMMAAANIAWEFSWSFLFKSDLGVFFTWGCRAWFFMDIFINRAAYMNGLKLVTNKFLTATYGMWYVVSLIGWFCIVIFMCIDHDDNELGVVSALLINVVMSSLYVYQLLNYPQLRGKGFSVAAGWFKMIGTGSISAASFILWFDNEFLLTMCILTFFLDCVYLYLYYQHNPEDFEQVIVKG